MKKICKTIYLTMFIILICLPGAFWILFGKYIDSDNYENRRLASMPVFHAASYENYPSEFEAFFNDTLPFRNTLISLNSWVNYYMFGTSVNDNVILGKDKWLFYDAFSDGNPIGDYEGVNTFSDQQVTEMAEAALKVLNRLGDKGIRLTILIPPNKERIYPEYMPDRYHYSEISRSDLMIGELQKQDIPIISPKEDLQKLQSKYQLYYPYDTHWNQLGGYVGVCSVLNSWGLETAGIEELTFSHSIRGGNDLANMLNLGAWVFNDSPEYTIMEHINRMEVPDAAGLLHYSNPQAIYNKCVFLLGDSYQTAMEPALHMYFTDVYVVGHDNYRSYMLEQSSPDYLIVEYVERHADRLAGIEQLVFEQ